MHKCGKLQTKCSGIKNKEETMQFNKYPIFFCTLTTIIQKKFHQIFFLANNYSNHKHQEAIRKKMVVDTLKQLEDSFQGCLVSKTFHHSNIQQRSLGKF